MGNIKKIGNISRHIINSIKLFFVACALVYIFGELVFIIKSSEMSEYAKIIASTILAMGAILIIVDEMLKMTRGNKGGNKTLP